MSRAFVRIRVEAPAGDLAERLVAEAWAAGASGLEEGDLEGGQTTLLLLYAPAARARAVLAAAAAVLAGVGHVGAAEPLEEVDWSSRWREGIEATEISARLAIRPSFVPLGPKPGQQVLVVDPGQAFGTGSHASTRLALELLDELPDKQRRGARVLDVGTGTGVLALAALRLGAVRAVACDLDARATSEARNHAAANQLASGLLLFTGSLDALRPVSFDIVLANLLRTELTPLLPALAAHSRPGGVAILSGLLEEERTLLTEPLACAGLRVRRERCEGDPAGQRWLGLLTTP